MRYPGGKGGAGVAQTIINLIPEHRVYIEPFVGGGNIYERKAPAPLSILVDLDDSVVEHWQAHARKGDAVIKRDALFFLSSYQWTGHEFVYLDPPYVHSARTNRSIYRCELSDEQHRALLAILDKLTSRGVRWLLSGYRSPMYDDAAAASGWASVDYRTMTRGGARVETAWFNYLPPARLAEFTYAGSDYRERERIKRKIKRWTARLAALEPIERGALLHAIKEFSTSEETIGASRYE